MRNLLAAIAVAVLTAAPAQAQAPFWEFEWPDTNFENTSITDWSEIMSGGPGKDGIPALTDPDFKPAAEETRFTTTEAVVLLEADQSPARAYPLRYLMWHEIVNDRVDGQAVAVTYCPLCNSAMVFDRTVKGQELEFGVTGKLRNSDMVMYDRQTHSWWQQAIGKGIVGDLTGVELQTLPARMVGWAQFLEAHPDGLVMKQPAHARPYGSNPYRSYDLAKRPFLYSGENPPHGIAPLARVVRVGDRAWPLERLAELGNLKEAGVTLQWTSGQASALEAGAVGKGRDVGSIRVLDGQGNDVAHDVLFAFAFHAFWPEGTWMLGDS